MKEAVVWLAIATMVSSVAMCTYGVTTDREKTEREMTLACQQSGGNWESGWNGKWCKK